MIAFQDWDENYWKKQLLSSAPFQYFRIEEEEKENYCCTVYAHVYELVGSENDTWSK